MSYPLEYGDSPDTAAYNAINPVPASPAIATYGAYAIVPHGTGRDRFYSVEYTGPQTIYTGHILRTFHYLRNARAFAKHASGQ
jgi:hypothetical protein